MSVDPPDDTLFTLPVNPEAKPLAPDSASSGRVKGEISRVVFASEDDSYSVVRLIDGAGHQVTAVGAFGGAFPGQGVEIEGTWEEHPDHGRQLRATSFKFTLPATADGIKRYLASGVIKGIGGKRAEMIVDFFGDKTLDVLDNYSARLKEIPGFGKKTIDAVRKAWKEHAEKREVLIYFQGLGISLPYCQRIYRSFGADALRVVREDPYRLAAEVDGIGFIRADAVAKNLGIGGNDPKRLRGGVSHGLNQLALAGHVCYPKDDFVKYAAGLLEVTEEEAARGLEDARKAKEATFDRIALRPDDGPLELVYAAHMFRAESELATIVKRLASSPFNRAASMPEVTLGQNVKLNPEQLAAVDNVRHCPLSVITGGPGVGKTTVIGEIVKRALAAKLSIALTAPTGRAAKRMSEATGLTATTIHRLLKWDPIEREFVHNHENPLKLDVLVVDEVSMLDLELARHLLRAVEPGAAVILVGDADQLPSVGPGNVLNDLIVSGVCPVTRLRRIYRQDSRSRIIPNAHAVNEGLMPDLSPAPANTLSDFYWIERDDPEEAAATIVKLVAARIPARFNLNPIRDVQVLSPMTKGVCGTKNLNALLQEAVNFGSKPRFEHGGTQFKSGDKLMQVVNNYDKGVFNGEIGTLSHIDAKEKRFLVAYDIGQVAYEFAEADQLRHAYAVTIHKSQGSEYPAVVAPLLTAHFIMLRRNLLYTAMTRAKKLLVLVGSRKALAMAVNDARIEPRFSALAQRLAAAF